MVTKCLTVMEDALKRFPDNSEVLLFFAEVRLAIDKRNVETSHDATAIFSRVDFLVRSRQTYVYVVVITWLYALYGL